MHTLQITNDSFGLSTYDRVQLRAAQSTLPQPWIIQFECDDGGGDVYAVVRLPLCDRFSGFLVDREGGSIVLTDNISQPDRVVLCSCAGIEAAVDYIASVLNGL